ncbi:MAG TPA: hypothetical protein PLK12_13780, partial [Prolixibacteraceae bacterium]|nr:hypothetical protein [Prolixibacteraceae bacterium]
LFAGGIALGLCVLTKGVFGLLPPAFAVLAFLSAPAEKSKRKPGDAALLAALVIGVSLPALIPLYRLNGWEEIRFFVWDNNFGRMKGHYPGTISDPSFYLHTMLYLFLPITLLFIRGTVFQIKKMIQGKMASGERFIFWGFWAVIAILSMARNKLPNYLVPLFPFAALVSARAWVSITESKRKGFFLPLHHAFLILLWILLLAGNLFLFPSSGILFWILFIPLAGFFAGFMLFHRDKSNISVFPLLLTGIALGLSLNQSVAKTLYSLQAGPAAARTINHDAPIDEPLWYFNPDDKRYREEIAARTDSTGSPVLKKVVREKHFSLHYELMFYAHRPVGYIDNPEMLTEALSPGKGWIFTNEEGKEQIQKEASGYKLHSIAFPDFNPGYPLSYLQYKKGNKVFPTFFLIRFEKMISNPPDFDDFRPEKIPHSNPLSLKKGKDSQEDNCPKPCRTTATV